MCYMWATGEHGHLQSCAFCHHRSYYTCHAFNSTHWSNKSGKVRLFLGLLYISISSLSYHCTTGAHIDAQPKRHGLTATDFKHNGSLTPCMPSIMFSVNTTLQVPQLSTFTSLTAYLQRVATPDTTARAAMKQMPALLDQRRYALQANTEQQDERAAGEALPSRQRMTNYRHQGCRVLQLGGRQLAAQQAAHDLVAGRARQGLTHDHLMHHA